jgi:hypothetical protein
VRWRQTIRCAPAKAAGVSQHLWSREELADRMTSQLERQVKSVVAVSDIVDPIDVRPEPAKPPGPYKAHRSEAVSAAA